MTNAASKALAAQVTDAELAAGLLFPSVSRLRDVSFEVATAVAREAIGEGVAAHVEHDVERAVKATMWEPRYPCFEPG